MKAELDYGAGVCRVKTDGEIHGFTGQRSFRPQGKVLHDFSEHGVKFFNIFPSGIMTALVNRTVPYSVYGPVWTGDHEYNWDNLRKQCREFFDSIGDDCFVSLSVHLDPPRWYVDSHPGFVDHWEQMHNNIGSEEWQSDAEDYMTALIDKVDEWYPGRVFAVLLFCGGTTEWYSYHYDDVIAHPSEIQTAAYRKYTGNEKAVIPPVEVLHHASDGVFRHPHTDSGAIGYWKFINDLVSDVQIRFARKAREHTGGSKLIGLFSSHTYGMHIDAAVRMSYNSLEKLVNCPDIDFICAPASYYWRQLSSVSAIRVPVDTLRLYRKLYIHEIDSSTCLSMKNAGNTLDAAAVKQHAEGRDEDFGSIDGTTAYMRREAGIALAKGQGLWWFDMFAGNYDDPALMKEIELLGKLQNELIRRDNTSLSEVAVFLDADSAYYLKTASFYPLTDCQTGVFNMIPCPWDQYDTFALFHPDFDTGKYSLYVFPMLAAPTGRMKAKIAELRALGKNILFFHAPGYITGNGFSTEAMEELTGIRFERQELSDNTMTGTGDLSGIEYDFNNSTVHADIWKNPDPPQQISPVFSAENLDRVYAVFRENGRPAAGIRYRENGGFDAYCCDLPVPRGIIDAVYREAGIFRYASPDVPVYANTSFECVYSYHGGTVTLYRRENSVFTDFVTGEKIKVGTAGTGVRFRPCETKLYLVSKD